MTTTDWETQYADLMVRATVNLEETVARNEETIEVLRPLVVVDAVCRAGYHPYQGDGHKLARLLLVSLEEGWLQPPLRVEHVWEVASMFKNGPLPDWVPYEGESLERI